MPLNSDLHEFIESLNSNEVEYLIVGAYAVALYGIPRYTGDLDVWIRSTAENAKRVVRALSQFGFGGIGIEAEDFQKPDRIIQLGVHPNRIDLLTAITGVTYEEAWASRVRADLDGMPASFIGREQLIRNKESTARPRDLADVAELRKLDTTRTDKPGNR